VAGSLIETESLFWHISGHDDGKERIVVAGGHCGVVGRWGPSLPAPTRLLNALAIPTNEFRSAQFTQFKRMDQVGARGA
jgi:hypothetical protein